MTITHHRYVRHEELKSYLDLGWVAGDALKDTHHGDYGELMTWAGQGEPQEPNTAGPGKVQG